MKKILFTIFALFFSVNFIFAKENLSEKEQNFINQVLDFRFNLRSFETVEECIKNADDYIKSLAKNDDYINADEEFKLTIDNLVSVAKFNVIYEKDMNSPVLKELMMAQYEKVIAYNEKTNIDYRNKWYIVTAYDVINSTMQFLPQSNAIKYGLEEKDVYDAMMKKYPDFSYLFINTGLWYMFAPAIGGGSDVKAMDFFQNAINKATTNYEKYYANLYYSQLLFDKKKYDDAKKYLDAADKLLPGKRYIKFIKLLNENGYSVYYYTNNKEKVDKKLGK